MKTLQSMSRSAGFLLIELLVTLCILTMLSAVFAHSMWHMQHAQAQASWYNKALTAARACVERHHTQHTAAEGTTTVDGITIAWTTVPMAPIKALQLPRIPKCSLVQVTATWQCAQKEYSLTLLGNGYETT